MHAPSSLTATEHTSVLVSMCRMHDIGSEYGESFACGKLQIRCFVCKDNACNRQNSSSANFRPQFVFCKGTIFSGQSFAVYKKLTFISAKGAPLSSAYCAATDICLKGGTMRRRSTALGDFLRRISVFFRNLPLPILRQLSKKVVLEQRGKDEEQINAHTLSAKHIIYIRAFARHTLGKPSRSIAFFAHNFINSSSYVHGPIVSRSFIITFQAFPKAPETYIFTYFPHSFYSSSAKKGQTRAMRTRSQIAECNLSCAKIRKHL